MVEKKGPRNETPKKAAGRSLRMFLVDDDDSVTSFPLQLHKRLTSGDATAAMPALAGKRARYVIAFVDIEGRRVTQVRSLECGYLPFDSAGHLDQQAQDEEANLAVATLGHLVPTDKSSSVRNAAHLFAQRAYQHRYKWEPSDAVLERISELLFPSTGKKGRR